MLIVDKGHIWSNYVSSGNKDPIVCINDFRHLGGVWDSCNQILVIAFEMDFLPKLHGGKIFFKIII